MKTLNWTTRRETHFQVAGHPDRIRCTTEVRGDEVRYRIECQTGPEADWQLIGTTDRTGQAIRVINRFKDAIRAGLGS